MAWGRRADAARRRLGGLAAAVLVTSALVLGRRGPTPLDRDTTDPAPHPVNSFVTVSADGIPQHEWTWTGGEALGTDVSHWATDRGHVYLVVSITRDAVVRDETVVHLDGRVERRVTGQNLSEAQA